MGYLVTSTATNVLILPYMALIEGSGKVKEIYAVRLVQGISGAVACWVTLILSCGLWAAAMVSIAGFIIAFSWLVVTRPALLSYRNSQQTAKLDWKREVWPLQWRVGLSIFSGYLMTQIYTPILFHYQGALAAGQMDLSLTIANMLGILVQSWIAQRVPAMAQAASRKDWSLLDYLFKKDFLISIMVFILVAIVICMLRFF